MLLFNYHSEFDGSVEDLFAWHEEKSAFERLSPPWQNCELIRKTGGLEPGSKVTLYLSKGPIGKFWEAKHTAYEKNVFFEDIQEEGPFAQWKHRHCFEKISENRARLVDRVKYELPCSSISHPIAKGFAEKELVRLFRYRHGMTRRDFRWYMQRDKADLGKKVLISGATGFIGKRLSSFLEMMGWDVWSISRSPGERTIVWDLKRGELPTEQLEGFEAVIHLAGETVAQRWTEKAKRTIYESRVKSTKLLVETIKSLTDKPKVFICASGVNYYGCQNETPATEEGSMGDGFLAEVVEAWEGAAQPLAQMGIRLAFARTGVVLHPTGGSLKKMLLPFSLGMGGPIGKGMRKFPWIGLDDLVYSYYHILKSESLEGPVNLVAPQEIDNRIFTQSFAKALKRPALIPLPPILLKLIFGKMAKETILCDLSVKPAKLLESGFSFTQAKIGKELAFQLGR